MARRRAAALALALTAALARPAGAHDSIADKRNEVAAYEARVAALGTRLTGLLAEHRGVEDELIRASGALGISRIRLQEAEEEASGARAAFASRAREAYKRAGLREVQGVLGNTTLGEMISAFRFLTRQATSDAGAYHDLLVAQSRLATVEDDLDGDRAVILRSGRRLGSLRLEIENALRADQRVLAGARSALAILQAQRLALSTPGSGVTPAVERMRSARQKVLDQRLAALLAWFVPGSGAEPFIPARLRATGIVTSGLSSWYGPGFHGRRASSGATFNQDQLTAASRVLPFGTLLKVTFRSLATVVVITDRGPYVDGRVLDLSAGAARAIGLSGVQGVRMEIVVPAEPGAPPFP